MDTIAVGICQIKQGYDFQENISRAAGLVEEAAAKGAQIVVLPEMFITPYEPASIRSSAPHAGKAVALLKGLSLKHGIVIVAGSVPLEDHDRRFFNRSIVIGESGEEIFRHDKVHLFDCNPPGGPAVRESDVIVPGRTVGTFETHWGTASVVICYDIRFTPLAQILADMNVRLLFVPAAFSLSTGTAHWEMLVRSRALEIQGFVVGVQPAYNPELKYVPYGHSLIASPWGEVILDAGEGETVEVVSIDMKMIDDIRQRFPLLSHRRRDLYATVRLVDS